MRLPATDGGSSRATEAGKGELAAMLIRARSVFVPKKYDCLGCAVCYPAIAANAFVEAYPEEGGGLDLCPTEEPEEREGWPPLPGAYFVIRYGAPVAVCALNSEPLAKSVAERKPEGLAIVGTMHTENLGIERVIKNTLANSHVRFLLLCGEDTQQAVGHLPGQSFENLFRNGLDEQGRIIGARGKRPVLKNISREEVQAFMQQVELVSMIGEEDPELGRLSITVPDRWAGALPANETAEKWVARSMDFSAGRSGYQEDFLGKNGLTVPLPQVDGTLVANTARVKGREDGLLTYTHFSIRMRADRRLPLPP